MEITLIPVDQAILVRMQNENETLHKLVIELQASNAQLQSQLLDIQVSNINTNTTTTTTTTTTAINKNTNVHKEAHRQNIPNEQIMLSSNQYKKYTNHRQLQHVVLTIYRT